MRPILRRLLSFLLLLVLLLAFVGLAAFGLAALLSICPQWTQFLAGIACGWIAWDASGDAVVPRKPYLVDWCRRRDDS